MRIIVTAAAGALALAALAAPAQELTTGHLSGLDTDGDGSVSAEELGAFMAAAFARLDADGDGAITAEEAAGVIPPEAFAAADADGDGALGRAEFDARVQADFQTADRDGSGALN